MKIIDFYVTHNFPERFSQKSVFIILGAQIQQKVVLKPKKSWSNQAVKKQNKVFEKTRKCVSDCIWNFRAEKKRKISLKKNTGLIFKLSHRSGFDIQIVEEDWKMYFLHVYVVSNLSRNTFFTGFLRKNHHSVLGTLNLIIIFLFFYQSNIALTHILKHKKIWSFCVAT